MENAADALKIAFAIFVFVVAITIVFTMVSKAKSTADTVLYYSDNTNFRDHVKSKGTNIGISEVIATLYRYYNESVAVTIKLKDGKIYNFDLGYEFICISESNLRTIEDIEKNLGKFIVDYLPSDAEFTEEFVEVPISGIYMTGSDGSEITLSSGGKKVYVTYTQI